MAKPKERNVVQIGLWIRQDLVEKLELYRFEGRFKTKTAAIERLLEYALDNPPALRLPTPR